MIQIFTILFYDLFQQQLTSFQSYYLDARFLKNCSISWKYFRVAFLSRLQKYVIHSYGHLDDAAVPIFDNGPFHEERRFPIISEKRPRRSLFNFIYSSFKKDCSFFDWLNKSILSFILSFLLVSHHSTTT